ncbi:MAG: hypothetical protein K2P78_03870, partial [Gemmataceae bacterium]|nr:hypothetical protein [Gemmataceae bacterium]
MILSLSCPACQAPLKFKGQIPAGAVARCPRCKGIVPLPAPPPADATAASVAPAGDATATYRRGDGTTTFQPGQATATFAPPAAADPRDVLAPPEGPGEIGRLGPYRVTGRLGAGGMGLVFRAEDPQLKRQVALKVMLPRLAADPAAKARFLREARAQAQVEHD